MRHKRRGNGEGSIYQRADGTWCATYSVGYSAEGKRLRRTVFGETFEKVRAKLTRVLSTRMNRPQYEPSRLKLCEYLERWLEDAARPTVRVTTYASYRGIIKNHLGPRLGGVVLAKVSPPHIQGMYAEMERDGLSPRLRQLTHAVLRRSLRQAVLWGMLTWNPCDAVLPPRVARAETVVFSPEEVTRLLAAAAGDRLEALYVLAVTTGMRLGELFALHWPDVDLTKHTVHIRRTLVEVNGKLELAEPKTQKSRRSVYLPEIAVEALRRHRALMAAEGFADVPWVFCNTQGRPMRRSHFHAYQFKPLLKDAGLPAIRFHDLRHTSATLLLAAGVHPKVVQERLGHSQINVTLDIYSHVLPSLQLEAAEKLDRILRSASRNDGADAS